MPDVAQYPCSVIYGNFPDTFSFHIFAFPFVRFHEDKSLPLHFSYLLSEQHILCKGSICDHSCVQLKIGESGVI